MEILLAFFLIVGISFGVAATNLSGLVSEYLFDQRKREDGLLAEKAAAAVAPFFEAASGEELGRILEENAQSMNGRLMLIDPDGKIQYDTFNRLCGRRTDIDEVVRVLTGEAAGAYGTHRPGRGVAEAMSGEENAENVAYCATEMTGGSGRIGVLLFVSRIQGMMDSLNTVRLQLITVFAVIALAALILALFLSQILTKPITDLSRTMRKMGQGDLTVRAPVRGSRELRELAENYNAMAAQLESMDKSRNQFVSNASHELRTPLTTMKIMLETVMYQPEMPQELREEFMGDMNHEIDRLTGIVNDLLTLTRMDNRSVEMHTEKVNMTALTEETVRLLTPAATQRKQHLSVNARKGLEMEGDRSKLGQILYNLIDNAMKYTADGGHISVLLTEEEDAIVWRVRDNGVGIPAGDLEHIFERFYRVDKARSRETGGTGLGLSIVRQLVTMHQGTISVKSELNQGSEFTVTFPRKGAAR